ncbi:MAG: hypothetical protein ACREDR_03730 [Blastocatellia bacterium]
MYTEAWTAPRGEQVNQSTHPHFYLSRLQDLSAREVEFRVLVAPSANSFDAQPLSSEGAAQRGCFRDPDDYLFRLKGSTKIWYVVRTMEISGQLCVVLRQES